MAAVRAARDISPEWVFRMRPSPSMNSVVGKAEELSGVYAEIERELRSQYLLAFAPNPPGKAGEFSPVEVRVKGGLKARAPRGYYP